MHVKEKKNEREKKLKDK